MSGNEARDVRLIYHMLPAHEWQAFAPDAPYVAATLASEGFIHCTREPERLIWVANQFYQHISGEFVILVIALDRLGAEVRWEEADGHLFPHIYGPINRDAICQVLPFPRGASGEFLPPNGNAA